MARLDQPTTLTDAPAHETVAVVVDNGAFVRRGQVGREAFFVLLERAVRTRVDEVLTPLGRTSQDCPYIERYLDHYRTQPLDHLHRVVRRYAAPTVDNATGWVEAVADRAAAAALDWRQGRVASFLGNISPTGAADLAEAIATDPIHVQSVLGSGRPLDTDVRRRMETTFGHSLARVRVHTDEAASRVAGRARALAFTVGDHIGVGGHAPNLNSAAGTALLAHEAAHAVQQRAPIPGRPERQAAAAEREADSAAAAVLAGGRRPMLSARALQLQRCSSEGSGFDPTDSEGYHRDPPTPAEMIAQHTSDIGDLDEDGLGDTLAQMLFYSPADHSDYISRLFQLLEPRNRDDVAAVVIARLPDTELTQIAATPSGRRLLEQLVPELTGGWTFPGSDIYAATRAVRAVRAREASGDAARREIARLDIAADAAVPTEVVSSALSPAQRSEQVVLIRQRLTRIGERFKEDRAVSAAVESARRGLGRAATSGSREAGRTMFAAVALTDLEPMLVRLDQRLVQVGRSHRPTEAAELDVLDAVKSRVATAIGSVFTDDGPQRLSAATTAVERLSLILPRLDLAVLENRPALFASVESKAVGLRSFARWAVTELEALRDGPPVTTEQRRLRQRRLTTLFNASRLLAHWEVLLSVAEALESGFSFTEAFYGHSVDVNTIHRSMMTMSQVARDGSHGAFARQVDDFIGDERIQEFYDDVPRILRSSGIAVSIAVMVGAAIVTMGVGSLVAAPGAAAGGTAVGTAGATAAGSQSLGSMIALSALDALVFTSVHQGLSHVVGVGGGESFIEEFLWNFGLFSVLRIGGQALSLRMQARGWSRVAQGRVLLGGAATVLEGYGVLRFVLEEGRFPTGAELLDMTAQMVAVLAMLVLAHAAIEPHTPVGRFNREFGPEFRAIEADRARLQANVNAAVREGTIESRHADFQARAEGIETRARAWADRAGSWSSLPSVRQQLGRLTGIQEIGARFLAESMGMPPEVALRRAGTSTDFSFARGKSAEVADRMRQQGADVQVTATEGEPAVVEARFGEGQTLQMVERLTEPVPMPAAEVEAARRLTRSRALRRRVGTDPTHPADAAADAQLLELYAELPVSELVQMARRNTRWDGYYARRVLDAGGGRRSAMSEYMTVNNIEALRDIARHDREAFHALVERYYRDFTPQQLENLANGGDSTAQYVLDNPRRGPSMDPVAEYRLVERIWESRRTAAEVAETETARQEALTEGTVGALETDIPGVAEIDVRGSPRAPTEVDPATPRVLQPATDVTLAQFHAEEQLLNRLIQRLQELGLQLSALRGRVVRIVVDQGVCGYCQSGLATESSHAGTIRQFAERYPGIRLELTDLRTGDFMTVEGRPGGGVDVVHRRRAGTVEQR